MKFRFNLKLLRSSTVVAETVIEVSREAIQQAAGIKPVTDNHNVTISDEKAHDIALDWMFDVEKSINANSKLRCHIEELPPDVPTGVKLDDDNATLAR
jgi:hypothetical protein